MTWCLTFAERITLNENELENLKGIQSTTISNKNATTNTMLVVLFLKNKLHT